MVSDTCCFPTVPIMLPRETGHRVRCSPPPAVGECMAHPRRISPDPSAVWSHPISLVKARVISAPREHWFIFMRLRLCSLQHERQCGANAGHNWIVRWCLLNYTGNLALLCGFSPSSPDGKDKGGHRYVFFDNDIHSPRSTQKSCL
jgi:hypothetical protein